MKALVLAVLTLGLFLLAVRLLWSGSFDRVPADSTAPHQRYARLLAMDPAEFRWRVLGTLLSSGALLAVFLFAAAT